jgi:hypothetical protein
MSEWEKLLWGLTESIRPYTAEEWQIMTEGFFDSFCKYLNIPFEHAIPPWYFLEDQEQCMGFSLVYKIPTPIESFVYHVRGSISTFVENNNRSIDAGCFLFLYFGKTRLLGEIDDIPEEHNDYMNFIFERTESGLGQWINLGWTQADLCLEWHGHKY